MNTERGARELPANRGGETLGHEMIEEHEGPWSRVLHRVASGSAILLAALAISMMLSNCGGEKAASASGASVAAADPLPASTAPAPTPVASTVEPRPESVSSSPDFTVTVSTDSTVVPGEIVELVVQATVDVSSLVLYDGLHEKQAFEYDVDAKAWRASYRVPMQPTSSRIGLSITAKNDAGRWARRWVFLSIDRESSTESEEVDVD